MYSFLLSKATQVGIWKEHGLDLAAFEWRGREQSFIRAELATRDRIGWLQAADEISLFVAWSFRRLRPKRFVYYSDC